MRHLELCLTLLLVPLAGASELSIHLDKAVQSIPEGGQAGLAVYDSTSDTWLYLAGSTDPLCLASTTKLLTTVAAYHHLGPDYQFSTRLLALGPLVDGAVPAVGVIGGGDPCLDSHFYDDQPEEVFRSWAKALAQLGIHRIVGDVVIDNRLFSGPIRPSTYPQDSENQQRWYSAPASAFAWNDNCIEVRVVPTVPGHPAEVQVRPLTDLLQVHNLTRTASGETRIAITREADSNAITVSGSCGKAGNAWFPLAEASDPDVLAGEELRHVLIQQGIAVGGTVRIGAIDQATATLVVDERHHLQEALTLMNQHSQNFYAEQMLRMVGAKRSGQGSLVSGCAAVHEALEALLGKEAQGVQVLDGSGLSYENRASAGFMVKMLAAMQHTPLARAFLSTLKTREAGKGHGYVKTGTHAVACCLVGYIDLPSNHRIVFAELLNRGKARSFDWSGRLRESIFRIICESAAR